MKSVRINLIRIIERRRISDKIEMENRVFNIFPLTILRAIEIVVSNTFEN
jgi:hypothetical protein